MDRGVRPPTPSDRGGIQSNGQPQKHDTNIFNSTFANAERDVNIFPTHTVAENLGLKVLREHIAVERMHDARERFPVPTCHFGTRVELLRLVEGWISKPVGKSRIFWLNGGVGVGKSAILQEIANRLLDPNGDVSASFFFGREKARSELGEYLFPTIAYQLATNIPYVRQYINDAVALDPTVPRKGLRTQFQSLIAGPLQRGKTDRAEAKLRRGVLCVRSGGSWVGDHLQRCSSGVLPDTVVLIDGLDPPLAGYFLVT